MLPLLVMIFFLALCLISEAIKSNEQKQRIDQLERDLKHLDNHVENIRKGIIKHYQIPPQFPGDAFR